MRIVKSCNPGLDKIKQDKEEEQTVEITYILRMENT